MSAAGSGGEHRAAFHMLEQFESDDRIDAAAQQVAGKLRNRAVARTLGDPFGDQRAPLRWRRCTITVAVRRFDLGQQPRWRGGNVGAAVY